MLSEKKHLCPNKWMILFVSSLIIGYILTGCGSREEKTIISATYTQQATLVFKTATQLREPTLTAEYPQISTSISNFTPTYTPFQSFSTTPKESTATPYSFRICSPLADHSWLDLQEIVTNPFNPPPPGKDIGHHGVDFAYYRRGNRLSIQGVLVESVFLGNVAMVVKNRPPYGNTAIIETPRQYLLDELVTQFKILENESLYLLYAHMQDTPEVSLNEVVACGQVLGKVGNTPEGWSSAPHLHIEARIGLAGITFSGMANYDNSASIDEIDNYNLWRTSGKFRMVDPMLILHWLVYYK